MTYLSYILIFWLLCSFMLVYHIPFLQCTSISSSHPIETLFFFMKLKKWKKRNRNITLNVLIYFFQIYKKRGNNLDPPLWHWLIACIFNDYVLSMCNKARRFQMLTHNTFLLSYVWYCMHCIKNDFNIF